MKVVAVLSHLVCLWSVYGEEQMMPFVAELFFLSVCVCCCDQVGFHS